MRFQRNRSMLLAGLVELALAGLCLQATEPARVSLGRVPHEGIQPQAALDEKGVLHLIYLAGDPGAADVYYVRKAPAERDVSRPIRVNSQPGSAIATGTIRGAHIAIGRNGRVHVAWNGSRTAEPKVGGEAIPMLYARLNDRGDAFEPQRSVMLFAKGLDGGGTVAADRSGNVLVAWHGMGDEKGESHRRVWVARSSDDGRTFAREVPAWSEPTGACGCCGMRAFADPAGNFYLLYRAATHDVERDMVLLVSRDRGQSFRGSRIQEWKWNACPMSSESFASANGATWAAWEKAKQVYFARIDAGKPGVSTPIAAPGEGSRKHPVVAINAQGEVLLAWAEGTGWKKGGAVAWQVFDKNGAPTGEKGQTDGLPAWSMPAAYARPDGGFTIIY